MFVMHAAQPLEGEAKRSYFELRETVSERDPAAPTGIPSTEPRAVLCYQFAFVTRDAFDGFDGLAAIM
ncbi:hypothetical protein [Burkholderia ubonensis]|uniref:hypothetical protein n=1 Tax=Burkholderia ubonensis TaxID=101571 RepID=UPI0012FA309D|nr:hypothetical protein [Burkholderia ubonensis]